MFVNLTDETFCCPLYEENDGKKTSISVHTLINMGIWCVPYDI